MHSHAQIWERPTYVRRVECPEPPHPIPDNRSIVIMDWEYGPCWIVLGELSYCYLYLFWLRACLRRSLSLHDTQLHILLNEYYDSYCYLKFLMPFNRNLRVLFGELRDSMQLLEDINAISCHGYVGNWYKQQRNGHAEGTCMAELNARNARTKEPSP